MRILPYPVFALTVAASIATAQSPQTSVDISVSASYANSTVRVQVTRKDPPGAVPFLAAKVAVSAALKGEKPFFSTVIEMKPGSSQSVSAPYSGPANTTVTVSAMPLDLKEMNPADNTRDVSTAILMVVPMTRPMTVPIAAQILKTGGTKSPAPSPAPAPAPPPAPAPAPARTPAAATLTTSPMVLVGGAVGARPVGMSGANITTVGIVLRGGTQGSTPGAPAGMTITTSPITLIGGKQE